MMIKLTTIYNLRSVTGFLDLKNRYDKTLKNIPTISGFAEDFPEVYENCADILRNYLRLNEIYILILFQFNRKANRNQLEIVVEPTYGLYPNKYFKILNIIFGGRSLVTRSFGLHSNTRGAEEIRDSSISIDSIHLKLTARVYKMYFLTNELLFCFYDDKC